MDPKKKPEPGSQGGRLPHDAREVPEDFAEMGGGKNQGVFDEPTLPRERQGEVPPKTKP